MSFVGLVLFFLHFRSFLSFVGIYLSVTFLLTLRECDGYRSGICVSRLPDSYLYARFIRDFPSYFPHKDGLYAWYKEEKGG